MAERSDYTLRTIEVSHIAKPLGIGRENPPHLGDLREFVAACEGLPDELLVTVQQGRSEKGGRRDMTISVRQVVPVSDEADWL
jgi:hypothetical protein